MNPVLLARAYKVQYWDIQLFNFLSKDLLPQPAHMGGAAYLKLNVRNSGFAGHSVEILP